MNAIRPIPHERLLLERVRRWEDEYNPELGLLRVPFHSPGYHTTLRGVPFVHATYPNLIYAVALLDTGLAEYERRAFGVIENVVSLQDTDPGRDTYGIWPWFYEEPLERMSPPDWNWADFCGKLLVQAVSRHGNRIPAELAETVKRSIFRACDAIIKRNVGPSYTNIAIMGSYVTLLAGELYGRGDYAEYGLARLERFADFTRRLNAFQEYNSPTYAVVAIVELSKIASGTRSERARELAGELLDLTWRMVAEHFHPATGQWSGPHSRCYQTLLGDEVKSFLQVGTDGAVALLPDDRLIYSAEWYKAGIRCPDDYIGYFLRPDTRTVRQLYVDDEKKGVRKWATTHVTPSYSLGTFSREITWNQCRDLLAYIDNGGEPVYVHLRCLSDGYDFSSGLFESVQHEGDALFGVGFFTNGGHTHPVLDKTGGTLETGDFRLRFEVGGRLDGVGCTVDGDTVSIRIGPRTIRIRSLYAAFVEEGQPSPALRWETVRSGDGTIGLDLTMYAGPRRTIDLRRVTKAGFVFALSMDGAPPADAAVRETADGRAEARCTLGGSVAALSVALRPDDV
ncbi:hypothetical protein [Paenibacillus flagellatus]|uniref:Heparinase n=1 Tax=Paenibacillus flagellatus TaxID=2211139 RepID=A0A2V5JZA0_9BACL|nr:hypothetical protein [Paenibacillus flagellatus]PYI52168.1 hypothetical protein DLM86_22085 [Paenibacillus flagellatus]